MNPLYIDIRSGHAALRHVCSGSVQQGLSAIRRQPPLHLAWRPVPPDDGKTLLRSASAAI